MHLLCSVGSLHISVSGKRQGSSVRKRALVSQATFSAKPSRSLFNVRLFTNSLTLDHPVLGASGADESFMDWELVKRLGLTPIPLPKSLEASALDGRLLCKVTHHTQPTQMIIDINHSESLSFHLFNSPLHPLILGYPWLVEHNPHLDWPQGGFWGGQRNVITHACLQCLSRMRPPLLKSSFRRLLLFLSHSLTLPPWIYLTLITWSTPRFRPAIWISRRFLTRLEPLLSLSPPPSSSPPRDDLMY